jgi:hypothetical protein
MRTTLRSYGIIQRIVIAGMVLISSVSLQADSTINSTNAYSWGTNIGWLNWRGNYVDGVVIGEYVCSGYIWGANVGWINMGSGLPANNIQYQNNSATDFGVNYSLDPAQPGVAFLRGYAYGANIGWINFEAVGNPRLSLVTGTFSGYAYSANCGWINLNDVLGKVQTNSVAMGADSDSDGIADAFEFQYFGSLSQAATGDVDGDGISNLEEYQEATNPTLYNDRLRITAFSTNPGGTYSTITWISNPARLYVIETNPDLLSAWQPEPAFGNPFAPDVGSSTTRILTADSAAKRFYRVKSLRPLP